MYTPQGSETSVEAIFRSKSRPAWTFSLQKRQYLCMEKSLQTRDFLSMKWETEENQVEKESRIRLGAFLLNQLPMHH